MELMQYAPTVFSMKSSTHASVPQSLLGVVYGALHTLDCGMDPPARNERSVSKPSNLTRAVTPSLEQA